jgi:hypothetical protein
MGGLSGNNFYNSSVFTANTTGTQIGLRGSQAATTAGVPVCEGKIHTLTIGADTTATTITVYDNNAASGTVLLKVVTPTTPVPVTLTFDVQATVGLYIVISGGTTPNITLSWA